MGLGSGALNRFRATDYIPITQFSGLAPITTVTKAAILTAGEIGVSADAAEFTANNNTIAASRSSTLPVRLSSVGVAASALTPYLKEMTTGGIVGLVMPTVGDQVGHFMQFPLHWDRRQDVKIRVLWTVDSHDDGETIDWSFLYRRCTPNTAGLSNTLRVVPTTALDTVIPQDKIITGADYLDLVHRTEAGVLKSRTFTNLEQYIQFLIRVDAFDAGMTEDKFLLGVEFEYTPRTGRGLHRKGRAFPD